MDPQCLHLNSPWFLQRCECLARGYFFLKQRTFTKRKDIFDSLKAPFLRITTSINLRLNINLYTCSGSLILPAFLTLILCYVQSCCTLGFPAACSGCINLSDTFSPSANMLCLSCALSTSHLFPSSLLFLSLVLTLGPSGLCGTVLTLCMKGHLLQLEAFYFCLPLFPLTIPTISLTLSRLYDSLWN